MARAVVPALLFCAKPVPAQDLRFAAGTPLHQ